MANRESREAEYLRRMRALGYEPSLIGMDDEDIEWELARMEGGRREEEPVPPLNPTYRPVDRDFAERIFRMFARPFDPNWRMPDTSGTEYAAEPNSSNGAGIVKSGMIKDDEKWQERYNPGKIIEGSPGKIQGQPPVRIVIGDKEYPAEIDREGKIMIRF